VKRVKVDFSTTVKGGLIRANRARADAPLCEGDEVEAYDPAEDMEFVGVVDHLSEDGRFAFLRMQWEALPRNVSGLNLVASFVEETQITTLDPQPETSLEKGEGTCVSPPQVGPARPLDPALLMHA
jgi:hypothetical protein